MGRFTVRRDEQQGRAPWLVTESGTDLEGRAWSWAAAFGFALAMLAARARPGRGDGLPWIEL